VSDRKVAAFDFDGTITERDTLAGFLRFVGGRPAVAKAVARHGVAMVAGLTDDAARDAAKEAVLGSVLRGRLDRDVVDAGGRYAGLLPARFRPEIVERIGWHTAEGHELVIVSASLDYYLRPVAAALGFTAVIGVEMAVDDDGRITGSLARPNVRAAQKAVRLREWLDETEPDDLDPSVPSPGALELWAYGNSSGDDDLLALADHPTWVGKRASRNLA